MRKTLLSALFTIAFVYAHTQRNNVWYFGDKAGISFNSPANGIVPFVLTDGALVSPEGCASISDVSGNILFYTNGVEVYNRNHQVMLNGSGLLGNVSAVQSSIIIPIPGNDSLYYIFTTDAIENSFKNGYRYTIVNMNHDNGNGEVTTKNTLLWASCTERLTAAHHRNGNDIWLITNDSSSNVFRSWLITCNGLQAASVVSTIGDQLDQHILTNTGTMKVSADGKQLCQTHYPLLDENNHIPNFIQLFDFDNSTGLLSNARHIGLPDAQYVSCEFSPNSKLLYLTRPFESAIDQLQCTLSTAAAIVASRVKIAAGTPYQAIQAGPDGKLYLCTAARYLGAIESPNTQGTGCGFVAQYLFMGEQGIRYGLPSFINDLSSDPNNNFTYTILDSCAGKVQFNGFSTMTGTLTWTWNFGDGVVSNLQNPLHTFTPPDKLYTVSLKVTSSLTCGIIEKQQTIKPQGIFEKIDFSIINRCDSGYTRFENKSTGIQSIAGNFTWDFGDGSTAISYDAIHTYLQPNTYNIKLRFNATNGCLDDSLIRSTTIKPISVIASADQEIMSGQSVQLYATGTAIHFQWSPPDALNKIDIANPVANPIDDITYEVTGTDEEHCVAKDSVFIHVIQLKDLYVPTAFTPNQDGKNDIIKPIFGSAFSLQQFSIFDRWGQRIFTTRERGTGWDGKLKGIPQAPGMYVWLILAKDKNGKAEERKGTFALIR